MTDDVTHPVEVTAHRGASAHCPENTASAFAAAIALDVERIEFDVRRTRDGGLVIIHDGKVDRISNGIGEVSDLTLHQILSLDAGAWYSPDYVGERFLTLSATLDMMPAATRLNVHLKATDADRVDLVSAVVDELIERQLLDTAFITGAEAILLEARRRCPDIGICSNLPVPRCVEIGCRTLQPANSITTPVLVAEAHEAGIQVHPFFADDPEEMRRLISCGVDGILTNDPALLQAVRSDPSSSVME